jgi:hypothetical protein
MAKPSFRNKQLSQLITFRLGFELLTPQSRITRNFQQVTNQSQTSVYPDSCLTQELLGLLTTGTSKRLSGFVDMPLLEASIWVSTPRSPGLDGQAGASHTFTFLLDKIRWIVHILLSLGREVIG